MSSTTNLLKIISAKASAEDGTNVAAHVLDGDPATRWSAKGVNSWITLDLGSDQTVSAINVNWFNQPGEARDYKITVTYTDSTNAKTTQAFDNQSSKISQIIPPTPATAHSIKANSITLTMNSTSNPNDWFSISDITVSGAATAAGGTRVQTRSTTAPGDPVPDASWQVVSDSGPIPLPGADVITVTDQSVTTTPNAPITVNLSATVSLPTAKVAGFKVVSGPSAGILTTTGLPGAEIYTPNKEFVGTDVFKYQASDDQTPSNLSNVGTITITVGGGPGASGVDVFGVSKLYADGPGPSTFMDMTDPTKTRGAGLGQNPEGNKAYYPVFKKNSDGSWQNTNGLEVRWAWCAEDAYPGDNAVCKCYDTNNKTGNMGNAGDWPPRIEMTAYYKADSVGSGTRNGECHIEHVISGHRSTTSSTASGPGGCNLGCAGSYHCNKYPKTGRRKFEKDYHHSFAYAQDLSGVNNNTATPAWAGDGKWHGFKDVFYIRPDGVTVQLEQWTDWDDNNTWVKSHSYIDHGQWTPKASYSGCGSGPQNIVFLFNGPLVVFRADNWNSYSLKNCSVRSIDPTKPLMGSVQHAKTSPPSDFVEKNDEIYQQEGWREEELAKAKEDAEKVAEQAKSAAVRKQAAGVAEEAGKALDK